MRRRAGDRERERARGDDEARAGSAEARRGVCPDDDSDLLPLPPTLDDALGFVDVGAVNGKGETDDDA